MKKNLKVVGKFLNKHSKKIVVIAALTLLLSMTVFAADAEALWDDLTRVITTWVNRLGAVIIFVGGIMFALGWKSDDAEQKSKGISTVIAGGLVMGIVNIIGNFFA